MTTGFCDCNQGRLQCTCKPAPAERGGVRYPPRLHEVVEETDFPPNYAKGYNDGMAAVACLNPAPAAQPTCIVCEDTGTFPFDSPCPDCTKPAPATADSDVPGGAE